MERRKDTRHEAEAYLKIFDAETGELIGELANLSSNGAMLITSDKVKVRTYYKCRLELTSPILDRHEVHFSAQCRWCRKNIKKGRWESGYATSVPESNKELISYLIMSFELGKWEVPGPIDLDSISIENRRKSTRFEVKDHYPVYEQNSYRQIGTLADLSTAGTSLITAEPIEKGAVLKCRVKLPKEIFRREYLMIEAECRWCRKNDDTGGYRSGYSLQNVSEHDSVIILYLIIHFLEAQPSVDKINVEC